MNQFRLLLNRLGGLWIWFGASIVLSLVGLAVELATPLVLAVAIDQITSGTPSWGLQAYIGVAAAGLLTAGLRQIATVKWNTRLDLATGRRHLGEGADARRARPGPV